MQQRQAARLREPQAHLAMLSHSARTPLLALLLAASPVATLAQTLGPQLNIAHRGASAYAPEHTFYAYDLAMQMDVDMLECDLFITKDEVPVCIHDTTVDRTSDGSGRVEDFTLAELRELDFGSWFSEEFAGAAIVPFEEQLDCYLRHNPRMRFHVETKDSAEGRAEEVLVELLTRKGLINTGNLNDSSILMQSFDAGSLERIKQLAPTLPTAFLFMVPTSAELLQWVLLGTGPDYIDAFAPNAAAIMVDPLLVQRFHANGHHVHTWTVNSRDQMDLLLQLGVDGIFTNNPDLLREAIDATGNGTSPEARNNPSDFPQGCPGIAGRVLSKEGPGDVWAPLEDGPGVAMISAAPTLNQADSRSISPMRGGAAGVGVLGLLLLLARRRARSVG